MIYEIVIKASIATAILIVNAVLVIYLDYRVKKEMKGAKKDEL